MARVNVNPDNRGDRDSGGHGALTEATRNLTWASAKEEPPQAQQPEAEQAEHPAGGGQRLDQALQEQIAQAVWPILGCWNNGSRRPCGNRRSRPGKRGRQETSHRRKVRGPHSRRFRQWYSELPPHRSRWSSG
jgi:hypothetical protein